MPLPTLDMKINLSVHQVEEAIQELQDILVQLKIKKAKLSIIRTAQLQKGIRKYE